MHSFGVPTKDNIVEKPASTVSAMVKRKLIRVKRESIFLPTLQRLNYFRSVEKRDNTLSKKLLIIKRREQKKIR